MNAKTISQMNYIKFEFRKACEYLELQNELSGKDVADCHCLSLSNNGHIVGEIEIEGQKRFIPSFDMDAGQMKIRAMVINYLAPIALHKYKTNNANWSSVYND
jgi:hypothetical protein